MGYFESHTNQTVESFISLQNDVAFGFVVTLVVMALLNTVLHTIATHILISIQQRSSQIINLINLSIIQALVSFLVFLDESAELVYDCLDIPPSVISLLKKIECYTCISIYAVFCMYYVSMILLVLDRFLLVYLNIRYNVYWSPQKSTSVIIIVWFLATVTCVLLCVVHWIGVFNYQAMLTGIVSPVLNTFLLLFTVAVCTSACFANISQTHSVARVRPT